MKDELGNRMKTYYENRTRTFLPRRTYTIIRIDGKAFHTFTRGLKKPFDKGLIDDMNETAMYLCKNIQGAKIAYVQSDEISILLTDFDNLNTDAWFDGNIQKITSISSSLATSKFNQLRWIRYFNERYNETEEVFGWTWVMDAAKIKLANFDSRTFTIPSNTEVKNYFIWRQQDCVRNSVSIVAQSLYSHNELNGKTVNDMQELIWQKGQNWNDYPATQKRGRFISKKEVEVETIVDGKPTETTRMIWMVDECPTFTKETDFLNAYIPEL